MQVQGFNINAQFARGMAEIEKKGKALSEQMNAVMDGGEISNEQMLALQFQMGQYNALMETVSTVTKSMTDTMKSIAQRSA